MKKPGREVSNIIQKHNVAWMKHSKIREVRPRITIFNTRAASPFVQVRPKGSLYESLEPRPGVGVFFCT